MSTSKIILTAILGGLLLACGDQTLTTVTTSSMEQKLTDPASESLFKRGRGEIGSDCQRGIDCYSTICIKGICSHPCEAAACETGATCTRVGLGVPCTDDAACAQHPACQGRECYCGPLSPTETECKVVPYCYEICGAMMNCASSKTSCLMNTTLSLSVCIPNEYGLQ